MEPIRLPSLDPAPKLPSKPAENTMLKLLVPGPMVGAVIGRQGSTLKAGADLSERSDLCSE